MIHAMHKEAAARITLRTVADLERLGHEIAPLSYDIRDYARLGLLHKLLHVENPDTPSQATVALVQKALIEAVTDARAGARDLSNRFTRRAPVKCARQGYALALRWNMNGQPPEGRPVVADASKNRRPAGT